MIKRLSLLLLGLNLQVMANFNVYTFNTVEQEELFKALITTLRCPKCQNNNLADSNALLSTDIKDYIYQSVKSGKNGAEITNYLISRYGEFITFEPRALWLWVLPTAIMAVALLITLLTIFGRSRQSKKMVLPSKPIPSIDRLIAEYEDNRVSKAQ